MSSYKSKLDKFWVCKFSEISIGREKNVQQSIVHDRIPDESQMPEVCSVQSIPSCITSLEETCPERISTVSFDEMLKLSSSSSSSSHIDRKEIHYDFKSSIQKTSLEFQISPVKFNDLVHKLQKIVHSPQTHQKSDTEFQRTMQILPALPQLSSLSRQKESYATCAKNTVQYKVEKCLVIMKPSSDPEREFKESMMEMIAENKIKDGKDLEELLAWFLYMNSEDYHEVIIQVFKQIWNEVNHV